MRNILPLLLLASFLSVNAQRSDFFFSAPAGSEYTRIDPSGKTVIPNGRFITPLGKCYQVAPHPYGLALSNDGNIAVTANSGIQPLAITILSNILGPEPLIRQVPQGPLTDKGVLASVFMGLAVSPDQKEVYVAGGQENKVFVFNLQSREKTGYIDCGVVNDSLDYSHGYLGDMVLTADGKRLYVVDQIGFRVIEVDIALKKVVHNIAVGRYPFGLALSPDEKTLYVANVGMYRYGLVKRKQNGVWKPGTIDFPAFAYGSEEAEKGILNDTLWIPGLGRMDSDASFSVWAIDLVHEKAPEVRSKVRTGRLIGQMVDDFPAVGGSSPNSIIANEKYVFISNGNNDNITVLDLISEKVVKHIPLTPHPSLSGLRGVIPFGLDVSPDGSRVYAAASGLNAVVVIDANNLEVLGFIPVGWFPAKLKVTPDGKKLVVANAKGFGSGPNGGSDFKPGPEGTYIGSLMKGTVEVLDIPADHELPALTAKVMENNFNIGKDFKALSSPDRVIPGYPGAFSSPVKHIVFISKENRTYDEVFGQVEKGKGDPTIARYGRDASFTNKSKLLNIEKVTVMPNHLALAKRFGISDNFYVDSDVSADGHRWLVNTYPNEWVESTTPANYGGNRDYRENSNAPGNLGINGAAGAIYPEDYNEAGSMWDHLARHKVNYFNFGFSVMFEPADYQETYKYGGIKQVANFPLPASLFERTSRVYPTYNTAIPDQFRVDMFIREFEEKWGTGKKPLPAMITVILPNDHGAGERPEAGYPLRESYMADNDLALGRIVEYLSHTPYWKEMMIVVTEDDAQNGVDHIDAHRSILMLISPYAKADYVSHVHYSFGSIFKTFWNVLGLPYLNQYDAGATDMSDFFTAKPDFTPYIALPVDNRVFDPQKALDPFDEKFNWKELNQGPDIDDPEDMIRESKEQEEWRKEGREKK